MKTKLALLLLFSTIATIAQAQDQTAACHISGPTKPATAPARLFEGAGKVHMPITTRSSEAQAFFNQGLALLHSFWGYEADRSFERAAQLDPECAMAQWGIAMAAVNEARRDSAIKRAKELAPKATDRERLYIAAVEARYQGETATVQNNAFLGATEAYKNALRRLVSMYSDDLEAKLFLALASLNGYEHDGSPRPGTVEAIALCQLVLAKAPNHLAAHHYLIHAFESGKRAKDGEQHADVYGSLAPKVGHAVHMPGHIYVHVDRWDDAARVFENSAEIDRAYIRDNHESSDHTAGPYSHNLHFLAMVYGYQGRYRDALRISRELLDVARKPGEEKSRAALEGWLSTMRLLVRFEKWDDILDGKTLPDATPFQVLDGWRLYARGLARLEKGDLPGARADLESLEKESAWLREQSPKQKDLPLSRRQLQLVSGLTVAPFELRGRILAREGKADEAIATLRRAIEEEIKLGYSEPPIYPNPTEEVAGKTALSLGRWGDAEEFFRAAVERDPGSGRALFGLMLSQQGGGWNQQARESYALFVKAWARADADLSEMQRARENAIAHGYPSGKK